MHIIYLHGFCSSSASFKAQLVKAYVTEHPQHSVFLPDLNHYPKQAIAQVENHIKTLQGEQWGLVGSSLGGFYASYLAEKYNKKAVVINPAVRPFELLESRLGEQKNFHSEQTFDLTDDHLQQLKSLHVEQLSQASNFLLITKTADEVLDYRLGIDFYRGAEQQVITGGDHSFADYADYLETTFKFLRG